VNWKCIDENDQVQDETYVARVICLLTVSSDVGSKEPYDNPDQGTVLYTGPGDYAIIETLDQHTRELLTQQNDSWILSKGEITLTENSNKPSLFLVPLSQLHGQIAVFPHPISMDKDLKVTFSETEYTILQPVRTWCQKFMEMAVEAEAEYPRKTAGRLLVRWWRIGLRGTRHANMEQSPTSHLKNVLPRLHPKGSIVYQHTRKHDYDTDEKMSRIFKHWRGNISSSSGSDSGSSSEEGE
jgi:hypothetical protein